MRGPDDVATEQGAVAPEHAASRRGGRLQILALLAVGLLIVLAVGIRLARNGAIVTDASPPNAIGMPGPDLPVRRINTLEEMPSGPAEHVEVAYFHRTYRCWSCTIAERLTRETLDTRFADRIERGEMNLVVEDTEAPANPALVSKYDAWGSRLYLGVTKAGTVYTCPVDDVWFYIDVEHKFTGFLARQIRAVYGES